MKIAIVCYPTFGGSGVVATELGIALARRGHEVHFVTYKQPVRLGLLDNNIHFHEVHVPEYPLFHYQPYELALSSKLVDTIRLYDIELLHVHYAIPHAYAGYMAKKMLQEYGIFIPMITTLHGTDITLVGKHPFYKPAVTFSINKSDVVTSVSEALKTSTLELFDIEREIEVIPNFIEISKYSSDYSDCQRTLMAKENERIITHISNFRKVKRIPDVINVFTVFRKKSPPSSSWWVKDRKRKKQSKCVMTSALRKKFCSWATAPRLIGFSVFRTCSYCLRKQRVLVWPLWKP